MIVRGWMRRWLFAFSAPLAVAPVLFLAAACLGTLDEDPVAEQIAIAGQEQLGLPIRDACRPRLGNRHIPPGSFPVSYRLQQEESVLHASMLVGRAAAAVLRPSSSSSVSTASARSPSAEDASCVTALLSH